MQQTYAPASIILLQRARRTADRNLLSAIIPEEIIYSAKRAFGDRKKIKVLAHVERWNAAARRDENYSFCLDKAPTGNGFSPHFSPALIKLR